MMDGMGMIMLGRCIVKTLKLKAFILSLGNRPQWGDTLAFFTLCIDRQSSLRVLVLRSTTSLCRLTKFPLNTKQRRHPTPPKEEKKLDVATAQEDHRRNFRTKCASSLPHSPYY
jgi:hypothetical protein